MIYLYVPFGNNESNKKLMQCATQWGSEAYGSIIPYVILTCNDVFNTPKSLEEKTKIYILAFDAPGQIEESLSSSISNPRLIIHANELANRLLKSKLPSQGKVEIKLCIQQNEPIDKKIITAESMKHYLSVNNYNNPNLVINVRYSPESFPGENNKFAYYTTNGSLSIFAKENELNSNDNDDSSNIHYFPSF